MASNLMLTGIGDSGSSFTPTSIPTLGFWYDPSDVTSITKDVSNNISQMNDKSGNAYTMTQVVGANQPLYNSSGINSLGVVSFNDTDKYLSNGGTFNLASGFTFFVVTKLNTPATVNVWISKLNLDFLLAGYTGPGILIFSDGNTIATSDLNTSSHIVTLQYSTASGGLGNVWVDGVPQTTTGTFSASAINSVFMALGRYYATSADFFDGLIAENMCYQSVLSSTNKNSVGSYLATKWGLTWTTI